jgi:transglutaminase-like putative cysteine protease
VTAQPRGTNGSLLSSLPWTLAALGVALLPHAPYLPLWISAALLVCGAWRYTIEKRRRLLPSRWVRAALALLCFLGVLITYSSISGVGPGSALLAIMAALKLLETRKRRDQFVLLFISIFLVMSALLREQYLWSLPYLLFSIFFIMTAWLRMAAADNEPTRQSFRTTGRLLLYAAPLAIAMWVFFPRLASPFWAVPIDTSQGKSGLSENMSPGDISSLSLSNEVAFRVRFEGDVPAPRDRYWRGLVLTRFDGRSWSRLDSDKARPTIRQIDFLGEPIHYEITLEPTRQHWIVALDMPLEWSLSRIFMGPQQQLAHFTPINQRIAYEVTSHTQYRVPEKSVRNHYKTLPPTGNSRSRRLALEMRTSAASDAQFIADVMNMFNQQAFFYTLQPPVLGDNPIDRFLFDTRRGFCEHYASAFAFMMRSAGIPSRVVLGYQGGEVNPLGGHLIVRQSDAHAWTEVWLPESGWNRVDPTSAVAPERIEYGTRGATFSGVAASWGFTAPSALLHQLTMTLDAMDAFWNEWILAYGPESQNKFMEWLGMDEPNWRKMMLTLVAVVVGIVLLISGLLILRYRAPPKDEAARLFSVYVKHAGLEQRIGEAPQVFSARVSASGRFPDDVLNSVTQAYLQARYGPDSPQALTRLKAAVNALASCEKRLPASAPQSG